MQLVAKAAGWAAVAALTAGMMVGSARAAVFTETVSFNSYQVADTGQDIYLPVFSTALGTLTGASASLTGDFTPIAVFGFNPPAPSTVTVQLNPLVSLYEGGLSQKFGAQTASAVVDSGRSARAVGTADAVDLAGPLSLIGLSNDVVFPGYLDFYITASSGLVLPPNAYNTADQGELLNARLALTYTYTPATSVPEPGSLALLGTGLLGLCGIRFRRRRR